MIFAANPSVNEPSKFSTPIWPCFEWGLPDWLLPTNIRELLPHDFTIASLAASAVYFLLHFPSSCPAWSLTSILLYEVRTFLTPSKLGCVVVELPEETPIISEAQQSKRVLKYFNQNCNLSLFLKN